MLGLLAALMTYVEIIAPCFTPLSASSDSTRVPEAVSGQAPAATATITINHTSTKTVRIAETPSFGGLLSDIAHTVSSEGPRRTVCSVQPYSSNEILLKLSSGTKEAWLARGAIDIDVFRGDTAIQTKLSSTDEGLIIEIPYEEAHGVVNVSIVTTRKPKINETFAVDFGPDYFDDIYKAIRSAQTVLHHVAQKAGDAADGVYKTVEESYAAVLASADAPIIDKAASWWDSMKNTGKSAQDIWSKKAEETYDWMRDSIRSDDAVTFLKDVQQMAKDRHRHVEDFRDESELALIKAQIASKLWWLKIQGQTEQHEAYEREARKFMSKKHSEFAKAKKARETQTEAAKCARAGSCKDKGRWSI
ncbi:hypothetical protein M406DRAFT_320390 [Cryphonectria parasitica EP155]|uniref:Uncharacterized protein n=1 Tax=Cryphonectria parasitica (strain ATCC 38755 / EP155) TaxID=660469 RepID=A0A9P5CV12_CRYP1|nr:uncharacterized protein M406DRAFT_320390 [Cryphonectria parasitica EP155]KAF3770450.1 hypothetical protein M406DRAFT_320390 [Cryphonectria parasitica EP155]